MAENNCSSIDWLSRLAPSINVKTTRASGLMLLNAILMGMVVFIGSLPRYRRHPVIGALFVGAITLFLPIVSIIVTTVDGVHDLLRSVSNDEIWCFEGDHLLLVFLWTGVVVVIGINASEVVAGDAREGRNIAPPIMLLIKAIWTAYLTLSTMLGNDVNEGDTVLLLTLGQLFAIMFAKLVLKYAAYYKAKGSFALGRNPRLIVGYMAGLQPQMMVPEAPPALIVMGETEVQVEQQPHGFSLKRMPSSKANRRGLVTLDRVWGQTTLDVTPKDLCLSFALFKMLRCRFAKYTVSEVGFIKTSKFFRETLLHGDHHGRVFGIITDELSLINDYYYSSLPIYYSHPLLPVLSITFSLWVIGYCLYLSVRIAPAFEEQGLFDHQINCNLDCPNNSYDDLSSFFGMGSLYYDLVPLFLVLVVLVLSETRDLVSYICSNWTKLALIYHQINQAWWQRPRVVQRCVSCLLKYRRCKLLVRNIWDDEMRQSSVLVLPRTRRTPHLLLRHDLLRLQDRRKKVKVPSAVKAAIFEALKGESIFTTEMDEALWLIGRPSTPISVSPYGCDGKRPAYTILVWHIATTVFEVSQLPRPSDPDVVVATHLSRYCAYLVSSRPDLLPDNAEWCHSLYDEVKKDANRLLASAQGRVEYYHDELIRVLSADSNHEVLRNGGTLGRKLVDSEMGWKTLARFWVEMILYVAPSENLEGHAEAISHGGELITLLWALLAHAGIVDRVDADIVDTAADAIATATEGLC